MRSTETIPARFYYARQVNSRQAVKEKIESEKVEVAPGAINTVPRFRTKKDVAAMLQISVMFQ